MTEGSVQFDPLVIRKLACDVGNEELAFGFLSDYFDLLPARKARIISAVQDQDPETAMDAILSLKITSAMVGAKDTENRCRVLQSLVAGGNLALAGHELNAFTIAVEKLAAGAATILIGFRADLACQPSWNG